MEKKLFHENVIEGKFRSCQTVGKSHILVNRLVGGRVGRKFVISAFSVIDMSGCRLIDRLVIRAVG